MFRYWVDLKSHQFADLDIENTVAIMPVAATEQHGPHLPVGVDGFINDAIVSHCVANHDVNAETLILPTSWIGRSEEHREYPGSLSLSAETLRRSWFETGLSVARAGVKKLIFFNSHGGQIQVMQIVARELRIDQSMFVVSANWFQLGLPDNVVSQPERRFGIHAGDVETSVMLHSHPQFVDMPSAQFFKSLAFDMDEQFPLLNAMGAAGFGWQAQDLHPSGAAGNAALASAEKGQKILEFASLKLAQLIDEVAAFPLDNLHQR